ncbi:hypothetical protein BDV93DRAFT_555987 [Ceratobasidium sp. AG-I]|nr:hypothetical protein BDV93DRAFT_555987 [Ceratobasidium sp. AG-I]
MASASKPTQPPARPSHVRSAPASAPPAAPGHVAQVQALTYSAQAPPPTGLVAPSRAARSPAGVALLMIRPAIAV